MSRPPKEEEVDFKPSFNLRVDGKIAATNINTSLDSKETASRK